jgi:ubiquinone/menaquinone biosynthesis C-methylase UbiE
MSAESRSVPNESHADASELLRALYAAEGGVPSAFSARVSDYAAYRPGYPDALFDYLTSRHPPGDEVTVVDVGGGTGLFTRGLLRRGYRSIAVEPSREMREVAERDLMSNHRFCSLAGTAESLPLKSQSIDLLTAAQAFHWFNAEHARAEFLRVLKPAGEVAIIWNDGVPRDRVRSAVDQLLDGYSGTKRAVLLARENRSPVHRLFRTSRVRARSFLNEQSFDEDGFTGFVFSGSFVPLRTTSEGRQLEIEIRSLFRRFERNGMLVVRYRTVIFMGRPS